MPDVLDVLHPAVPPRRRGLPRGALLVAAGALATTAILCSVGLRDRSSRPLVVVPMPVLVTVAVPAPVAAPAPARVSAPPPIAVPAPEPVPATRATTPVLDLPCLLATASADPACNWDDGFPAISLDGKRIALIYDPNLDSARGMPGFGLELIDVATSRVIRAAPIRTGEEEEEDTPAKIAQRLADVQRWFDATQFRTMVMLPSDEHSPDAGGLFAELAGDAVRVVDGKTHHALWRFRFPTPASPPSTSSDVGTCHPSGLPHVNDVAWDPTTRTAFATALIMTSPCSCTNEVVSQAQRLPR
ncbi:MAG: hypothetical protein ABIY55_01245 [Kofleriaceae bacterium]